MARIEVQKPRRLYKGYIIEKVGNTWYALDNEGKREVIAKSTHLRGIQMLVTMHKYNNTEHPF